jgi:cysteine dioxygenase
MNNILSLEELCNNIKETSDFTKVGLLLKKYNGNDWQKYININLNKYSKYKFYANDTFEVFIITWSDKQIAPIHDHSCNGCWLKVLKGELEEKRYDQNFNLKKTNILKIDEISFMKNNIGYHSVLNEKVDEIAVTIHVYNPPNHNTIFFM